MPKKESIPSKTIVMKKTNIHKFGIGSNARALGRTLKLSSGPLRVRLRCAIDIPIS